MHIAQRDAAVERDAVYAARDFTDLFAIRRPEFRTFGWRFRRVNQQATQLPRRLSAIVNARDDFLSKITALRVADRVVIARFEQDIRVCHIHAFARNWKMSQLLFIGGDISSNSLSKGDSSTESLYRHSTRVTNYFNRHDSVLVLSNVKRVGVAPRVGRVGLPTNRPDHAVDVDCSDYWKTIPETQPTIGNRAHSWHLGDPVFTQDILETMWGVARDEVSTRVGEGSSLELVEPE